MIEAYRTPSHITSDDWDNSLINKNSHDILENPQAADMGFNMYSATNKIVIAIVTQGSLGDAQNAVNTFRKAANCSALGVLISRINQQTKADGCELRLEYKRRALRSAIKFEQGTITEVFDITLRDQNQCLADQCMVPARIIRPDFEF